MSKLTDENLADVAARIDSGVCAVCDGDKFVEYDEHQNEARCTACEGTGAFALATDTAKAILIELRELRELLATPTLCGWPVPTLTGALADDGPFLTCEWLGDEVTPDEAIALGAALIRAALAARGGDKC